MNKLSLLNFRGLFIAIGASLAVGTIPAALADGNHQHESGHNEVEHTAHWMAPLEEIKPNPVKKDPDSIKRGQKYFSKYCVSCHGEKALGDGPAAVALDPKPSNLVAMSGGHVDGDFAWKIANGRGVMPSWKGILTENQIWDLVNFIQNLEKTSKTEIDDREQDKVGHADEEHEHEQVAAASHDDHGADKEHSMKQPCNQRQNENCEGSESHQHGEKPHSH